MNETNSTIRFRVPRSLEGIDRREDEEREKERRLVRVGGKRTSTMIEIDRGKRYPFYFSSFLFEK